MQRWLFPCFLLLISGWNWETHPAFVESIYYSLPDEHISHLNLSALREGSIAPDRDFHDNRYHHYPPSYNLTMYWLRKARDAYRAGDFTSASYAFGVASHYVSDSFAAPHNIEKESSKDHSLYEDQGSATYLVVPCPSTFTLVDLQATLSGATSTRSTWGLWLETRDTSYPEEAVALSMKPLYHVFWQTFNVTCVRKETSYVSAHWLPHQPLTLVLFAATLYFLLETLYLLFNTP